MLRILSFFLIAAIGSPATAYGRCADFEFQPVKSLSVRDVGRLSQPVAVGGISVSWFDIEDHPWRGDKQGIAFLSARLGDINEQPIAGILYADARMELDKQDTDASAKAKTATFVSSQPETSCKKFRFSLYPDGRVTANDRLIGRVK